jgi:hypothetical protein
MIAGIEIKLPDRFIKAVSNDLSGDNLMMIFQSAWQSAATITNTKILKLKLNPLY